MLLKGVLGQVSSVGLFLVLQLFGSSAALEEYDACTHYDKPGICRGYSYCESQLVNQRITFCGYNSREAVVCCPETDGVRLGNADNNSTEQHTTSDPNDRIAVQKCNEYRKLSHKQVTISSLSFTPTVVRFEVPKCASIVKLIVGGNITKPGEFPHMAAIGWRHENIESFDCGGSLISDRYVLTAAHCYAEKDGELPSFVRLGDQNLARQDDGAHPKDVDIDTFTRHPNFKRSQGWYNDIALVKLVESVRFSNYIRPACLYSREEITVDQVIATGFGLKENFGDKSDDLLKVSLNIYDNQMCSQAYQNIRQLKKGIMENQMCVGNIEGGKDTCQGDSGGPLQTTEQDHHCIFYLIGITSFGQMCGSTVPAIYTRIAPYLDWIESIVWG